MLAPEVLAQSGGGGGGGAGGTLLLLALMSVAFWFLLVRPQRRRARALAQVQEGLAPGDRVVTHSGVIGEVVELEDAELVLESTPGVRLRVVRAAIASSQRTSATPGDDLIDPRGGTDPDDPRRQG